MESKWLDRLARWLSAYALIVPSAFFIVSRHHPGKVYHIQPARPKLGEERSGIGGKHNERLPLDCKEKTKTNWRAKDGQSEQEAREQLDDCAFIRSADGSKFCIVELRARSRIPKIDIFVSWYYKLSMLIYISMIIKYSALCLLPESHLNLGAMHLDCVLLGRNAISPRLIGVAKYFSLGLAGFHVAWRFHLLSVRPRFKFEALELIFCHGDDIISQEARGSVQNSTFTQSIGAEKAHEQEIASGGHRRTSFASFTSNSKSLAQQFMGPGRATSEFESLFYFKNPVAQSSSQQFLFRISRTARSRSILARATVIYFTIGVTVMLPAYLWFLYATLTVSLTRAGFALNHKQCVDWIRLQENPAGYSHIFDLRLPNPLPDIPGQAEAISMVLPLADLNNFNLYHALNVLCDIIDCHFVWFETLAAVITCSYLGAISSIDSLLYSWQITDRLRKLLAELRDSEGSQYRCKSPGPRGQPASDESSSSILYSQALIMDHFKQIGDYNDYNAFFAVFCITMWWVYSGALCFALIYPASFGKMSRTELYFIHFVATTTLIAILGLFSMVRNSTVNIYRLITKVMVLDKHYHTTKLRWTAIMKLYRPHPLHCFAVSRSSELSWLFVFKVSFRRHFMMQQLPRVCLGDLNGDDESRLAEGKPRFLEGEEEMWRA